LAAAVDIALPAGVRFLTSYAPGMGLHLLYAHEVCVWHVPLLLLFVLFTAACASSNLHGSIWRDEDDCDADEPGT
jgi:hypothetical protein